MFDQVQGASHFSKAYLSSMYHQLKIKEGKIPRMEFHTQNGLWISHYAIWFNKCIYCIQGFDEYIVQGVFGSIFFMSSLLTNECLRSTKYTMF